MNTESLDVRTRCRRCGGLLVPDQDGDIMCLICARPLLPRAWEPPVPDARRERVVAR